MTNLCRRIADYPIHPMFLPRWSPCAFTAEAGAERCMCHEIVASAYQMTIFSTSSIVSASLVRS
jgi:hypothetical protein